jgi:hypothetical protein
MRAPHLATSQVTTFPVIMQPAEAPVPRPGFYFFNYHIVTCMVVRVRNKRTSTSVDGIYYHFSYTRTLNYTYIQAVQRYSSFTSITIRRCSRTRISLVPLVVP